MLGEVAFCEIQVKLVREEDRETFFSGHRHTTLTLGTR
jgi:hypothetical protein